MGKATKNWQIIRNRSGRILMIVEVHTNSLSTINTVQGSTSYFFKHENLYYKIKGGNGKVDEKNLDFKQIDDKPLDKIRDFAKKNLKILKDNGIETAIELLTTEEDITNMGISDNIIKKYLNSARKALGLSTDEIKNTKLIKIKGIKGSFNHSMMRIFYDAGIEICHSSDKLEDKSGNRLIPDEGFHPRGHCMDSRKHTLKDIADLEKDIRKAKKDKEEGKKPKKDIKTLETKLDKLSNNIPEVCPLFQINGGMQYEGKLKFYSKPVAFVSHTTAYDFSTDFQNMRIVNDYGIAMSFDHKVMQNYTMETISGVFQFEIDITDLIPMELGCVIDTVMNMERMGRGYNTDRGGRIEPKFIELIHRKKVMKLVYDEKIKKSKIETELVDTSMNDLIDPAMTEWQEYLDIHAIKVES